MESWESPCQSRLPVANKSFQIKFTIITIIIIIIDVIIIFVKIIEFVNSAFQTVKQFVSNIKDNMWCEKRDYVDDHVDSSMGRIIKGGTMVMNYVGPAL